MAENRYLKLNFNWMESEWIFPLSEGAKLAWVQIMAYVKAYGFGGRAKAKGGTVFAQQNGLLKESVEELVAAAKTHGALVEEDGAWVLTGWSKHQGDTSNAERQERYRKAHQGDEPLQREDDEKEALRNALRNAKGKEKREEPLIDTGQPSRDEPAAGDADETDLEVRLRLDREAQEERDAEGGRVREFWDRAALSNDPVVLALCKSAFQVKSFKTAAPLDLGLIERTVERVREVSPGDREILLEIEKWWDYYLAKKHVRGAGHWWSTFENWCGKCYGRWNSAKRRGGVVAVVDEEALTPEAKDAAAVEAAIKAGSLRRLADGRVV